MTSTKRFNWVKHSKRKRRLIRVNSKTKKDRVIGSNGAKGTREMSIGVKQ